MTNLLGKPPLGQKQPKPDKPRKRMRQVSAKRQAYRGSSEGVDAMAHMGRVKAMPCIVCDAPPPSDAHHCTHRPPDNELHGYRRLPCAGRKSSDFDTIPLCQQCHRDLHGGKLTWLHKNGPDYQFLPLVRAHLSDLQTDF